MQQQSGDQSYNQQYTAATPGNAYGSGVPAANAAYNSASHSNNGQYCYHNQNQNSTLN